MKKVNVAASDLYPLVHALLASSGMKAAAAALQKEAKLVRACPLFMCVLYDRLRCSRGLWWLALNGMKTDQLCVAYAVVVFVLCRT